jgi:hypothetical protein
MVRIIPGKLRETAVRKFVNTDESLDISTLYLIPKHA